VSDAPTRENLADKIERLQRAEEEVRRLQDELLDDVEAARPAAMHAFREAVLDGLGHGEGPEAAAALVPIAEVLGELDGPDVCDLLVDLIGSDEAEVRLAAGAALQELAFDRFREVAEAVERAVQRLDKSNPALRELPFIISEVGEPGGPRILKGYLAHAEAEVVAAAIEALAMLGDPAGLGELRKLVRDPRTVQIEEEGSPEAQSSIGALAQEAIAMIEESLPEPPPRVERRPPHVERRPPPSPAGGNKGGGRRR
jgi:HEAT repeat protein